MRYVGWIEAVLVALVFSVPQLPLAAVAWQWMNANQNMSGWVQAIGTIIALGIAIAIPAIQHILDVRREEERRVRRSSAAATAIYPALLELKVKIDTERQYLFSGDRDIESTLTGDVKPCEIELPIEIDQSIDVYADMGMEGQTVLQLISTIRQYNRMVAKQHDVRKFSPDAMKGHLDLLADMIETALINTTRLHV